MRKLQDIEAKSQSASRRVARDCEHEGEFSASQLGSVEFAQCECWEKHRIEVRAFEACVPKKFWHVGRDDVYHNQEIFEEVVQHYCKTPQLKVALSDGAGLFLHGPNGCGKSMFLSFILMHLIRTTRVTVYYTTTLQLDVDTKRGFGNPREAERLEDYLSSHFLVIDELGKETFKDGDSFNRKSLEYWLRQREERNLPTLIASNLDLTSLRRTVESGGYGETLGSLIEGSMITVPMEAGDSRKKQGSELRKRMGW